MKQPSPVKTADARSELVRRIINTGVAGLGLGVAGRGLMGLRNLMQEPPAQPFFFPGPSRIQVPVLRNQRPGEVLSEDGDDDEQDVPTAAKLAGLQKLAFDMEQQIASMLPKGDFGQDALMVPATVLAGAGGVAGGWKLTDWLLKRHRMNQLKEDVDSARGDFQHAMAEQFQAGKTASAEPTLDQVYDRFEKEAGIGGKAVGALLLANLLVGGGAAYGV